MRFGARSFSIWDAHGAQVWDSGDLLEQRHRPRLPRRLQQRPTTATPVRHPLATTRAPSRRAPTIGGIDGRTYAFVGLERQGGVVVADVTDPDRPELVQYLVTRDFAAPTRRPGLRPRGHLSFVGERSRRSRRCWPWRTRSPGPWPVLDGRRPTAPRRSRCSTTTTASRRCSPSTSRTGGRHADRRRRRRVQGGDRPGDPQRPRRRQLGR